jgi:hypothetical protein
MLQNLFKISEISVMVGNTSGPSSWNEAGHILSNPVESYPNLLSNIERLAKSRSSTPANGEAKLGASKTRGKMINQIGSTNGLNSSSSYDSPVTYGTKEDRADAELRQLLGSDISDTESMRTGTWGRSRKSSSFAVYLLLEWQI